MPPVYSFIGLCIRCMSVCMPASPAVARVLCDLCRVLVRLSARTYVHTYATRAPRAYVDSDSHAGGSNQRAGTASSVCVRWYSICTVKRASTVLGAYDIRTYGAAAVNAVLHFSHGER